MKAALLHAGAAVLTVGATVLVLELLGGCGSSTPSPVSASQVACLAGRASAEAACILSDAGPSATQACLTKAMAIECSDQLDGGVQ